MRRSLGRARLKRPPSSVSARSDGSTKVTALAGLTRRDELRRPQQWAGRRRRQRRPACAGRRTDVAIACAGGSLANGCAQPVLMCSSAPKSPRWRSGAQEARESELPSQMRLGHAGEAPARQGDAVTRVLLEVHLAYLQPEHHAGARSEQLRRHRPASLHREHSALAGRSFRGMVEACPRHELRWPRNRRFQPMSRRPGVFGVGAKTRRECRSWRR